MTDKLDLLTSLRFLTRVRGHRRVPRTMSAMIDVTIDTRFFPFDQIAKYVVRERRFDERKERGQKRDGELEIIFSNY